MDRDRVIAGLQEARRIGDGYVPTEADLDDAPLIDLWTLHPAGEGFHVIAGTVRGHPTIPDGDVVTSAVLAMSLTGGWARTVSRYYRLGRQLGESLQ